MKKFIIISVIILFNFPSFSFAQVKSDSKSITPFDSNRLSKYSTNELINYLTLESINWHWENRDHDVIDQEIVDELVRRKDILKMINETTGSALDM